MKILILGSGGREHALAWKMSQSTLVTKIFIAPGNAGTELFGENIQIKPDDFKSVGEFVVKKKVDMVIVGPEVPLVNGICDYFLDHDQLKNIQMIGPVKKGAMLEGSKDFAKNFMEKYDIPTARHKTFQAESRESAFHFLKTLEPPYVLKADGLAAGKGVVILNDYDKAIEEINAMFSGKFGEAGKKVLIEEFLDGIELSVIVLTDGKTYKILPEAKDYKKIGEGDTGLNTGGMGAISPVPFADSSFMEKVETRIIQPTIKGINQEGIDYKGFVFFGLINVKGDPYVIEYNVRMGDPEAQVVIPRVQTDLLELLIAVANNKLGKKSLETDTRSVCTVVLASGGYPGNYEKGKGINKLDEVKDSIIFHAGTKKEDNKIVTSGGRVLAVSSYGKDMKEALEKSYFSAGLIKFDKMYYRKDIGFDL
ncbi:MAG: phosphoribosylamine--glycine ligase [Bacteroidales bacterium]|nr:phosphoribosylamine--glycine ligase [Bacteroidales bacterium]